MGCILSLVFWELDSVGYFFMHYLQIYESFVFIYFYY